MKTNSSGRLPLELRHDPNIKDSAKVLYSEISALCAKYGYCNASNRHLAKMLGKSVSTISAYISELRKAGYIHFELKENYQRKMIALAPDNNQDRVGEGSEPPGGNLECSLLVNSKPPAEKPEEKSLNSNLQSKVHGFKEWALKNLSPHTSAELIKMNPLIIDGKLRVMEAPSNITSKIIERYFEGFSRV